MAMGGDGVHCMCQPPRRWSGRRWVTVIAIFNNYFTITKYSKSSRKALSETFQRDEFDAKKDINRSFIVFSASGDFFPNKTDFLIRH